MSAPTTSPPALLQARLQELDYEVGKEEFSYWTAKRTGKR